MDDKKFWKTLYLYITKYGHDIIHFRPEKNDIWLINKDNELIRCIYSSNFSANEVDSSVYNIVKNEARLKKFFKLSSLKIKLLYFSENSDEKVQDYKKYKISKDLLIERFIMNDKNIDFFVKKSDKQFIDLTMYSDRYKNRVIDTYKNRNKSDHHINFYFYGIGLSLLLMFCINYILLYIKNISLYAYFEYNYQQILSGQFYRLLTDVFVLSNAYHLVIVVGSILLLSTFIKNDFKVTSALVILFLSTFLLNLYVLFSSETSMSSIHYSVFALFGAIFYKEIINRNNHLQLLYSVSFPIIYVILSAILLDINFKLIYYIILFMLGIVLAIILNKKYMTILWAGLLSLVIISGLVINFAKVDIKSKAINYSYQKLSVKLANMNPDYDISGVEKELNSKDKSILTYYELGMAKVTTSSISEAKKIFLEGIQFDNSFAPIYYQLALIEYSERNKNKALEHIDKALVIENNEKYKDFRNELLK